MKQMKRVIAMVTMAFVMLATVGCAKNTAQGTEVQETAQAETANSDNELYTITDSSGRTVELPKNIERIAPSGPMAQLVLYTLCPDKMVGWAKEFTEEQQTYIDGKYAELPVFGNFYGDTLNLEAVMTAKPQVIFDIGEAKKTVKEDMDGIQEKTGIPTVFVKMEMDSLVAAYKTLGEITGDTEQAEKIIAYLEETLAQSKEGIEKIPQEKRMSVYYGKEEGLSAVVKGTVHSDVVDYAGGLNVADVEENVRGGANEISMEQLLLWNPQVILFAKSSIYETAADKAEWKELEAIKNGTYYYIPAAPYNWMGDPSSINRVIGIKWLSNLLYPQEFDYDMVKETQDFYKLFYHCEITEAQVKELLSQSTYR